MGIGSWIAGSKKVSYLRLSDFTEDPVYNGNQISVTSSKRDILTYSWFSYIVNKETDLYRT